MIDASNTMITVPYFYFIAYFIYGLKALSLLYNLSVPDCHVLQGSVSYIDLNRWVDSTTGCFYFKMNIAISTY